jgi:uncharacterized protein YbaR (Trm112 family)
MSDTETAAGSGRRPAGGSTVDPKLLEILVCPVSKRQLVYDRAAGELISETARLAFPIRDGVPIMLVEEARSLDDQPGDDQPGDGQPGDGQPGDGR